MPWTHLRSPRVHRDRAGRSASSVSVAEAEGRRSLVVHAPVTASGCAVGDSVRARRLLPDRDRGRGRRVRVPRRPGDDRARRSSARSRRRRQRRAGAASRDPLGGTTSRVTSTASGTSARSRPRGSAARRRRGAGRRPALLRREGSITVDGVSLTVAALADRTFAVVLVPHAGGDDALRARVGRAVNLEVDVIAEVVERLLRP